MSTHLTGKIAVSARNFTTTMFIPDIMLDTQWADASRLEWTGERRLILAVLQCAVKQWLNVRDVHTRHARNLRDELLRWFNANDATWPFSFENCCNALDLDAGRIRKSIVTITQKTPTRIPRRSPTVP